MSKETLIYSLFNFKPPGKKKLNCNHNSDLLINSRTNFKKLKQNIPLEANNGEISWLGLEPMHSAIKFRTYPGLSLHVEDLFSLTIFFTTRSLAESETDRHTRL
jgi:hypothetical protein